MFGKRTTPVSQRKVVKPAPKPAPVNAVRKLDDDEETEQPKAKSKAIEAPVKLAPDTEADSARYALKRSIMETLIATLDISQLSQMNPEDERVEIANYVTDILAVKKEVISEEEQKILIADITNDILGYGPLEPLLARDDIADIMVNGTDPIFIEVAGKMERTAIRFYDDRQLLNVCQRIVSQVGRRVDESSPICDARLPDGSRVNVIAPPLAVDGTTLTIRKFRKDSLTLQNLVDFGSITPAGAEILKIIGRVRCNVLISGGTGSGKTTLLNCLAGFIDTSERVVTCEDAAELQLQQPHVVRLETRPPSLEGTGEVTMRDLVKNCLRMRPERIIVGEVRGPEAFDLLQAMNTGHDGSMGTVHANTPRDAMSRLEAMITMGGSRLPARTIREIIASSVDIIVQAQRLRDGSRRITHITEVLGMEGDVLTTQDLMLYDIQGEDDDGNLIGSHVSCGISRPKFYERARYFNVGDQLTSALRSMDPDNAEDQYA